LTASGRAFPGDSEVYPLSSEGAGPRALASLEGSFSTLRESLPVSHKLYLDTLDWRLHHQGLRLCTHGLGGVTTLELESNRDRLECRLANGAPPAFAAENLAPLNEFLRRHRRAERRRLLAALRSRRYRNLLDDWRTFLESGIAGESPPADARRAVVDVAYARIWRAYRRIQRDGRRTDAPQHSTVDRVAHIVNPCRQRRLTPAHALNDSPVCASSYRGQCP
jgi:hypothetical protein